MYSHEGLVNTIVKIVSFLKHIRINNSKKQNSITTAIRIS